MANIQEVRIPVETSYAGVLQQTRTFFDLQREGTRIYPVLLA